MGAPCVILFGPLGWAAELLWRYTSGYVEDSFRRVTHDFPFIALPMFQLDTRNIVVDLDVFWIDLIFATKSGFLHTHILLISPDGTCWRFAFSGPIRIPSAISRYLRLVLFCPFRDPGNLHDPKFRNAHI